MNTPVLYHWVHSIDSLLLLSLKQRKPNEKLKTEFKRESIWYSLFEPDWEIKAVTAAFYQFIPDISIIETSE